MVIDFEPCRMMMEMSQWVEIPGAEALGAEGEVEHQGDYFASIS